MTGSECMEKHYSSNSIVKIGKEKEMIILLYSWSTYKVFLFVDLLVECYIFSTTKYEN